MTMTAAPYPARPPPDFPPQHRYLHYTAPPSRSRVRPHHVVTAPTPCSLAYRIYQRAPLACSTCCGGNWDICEEVPQRRHLHTCEGQRREQKRYVREGTGPALQEVRWRQGDVERGDHTAHAAPQVCVHLTAPLPATVFVSCTGAGVGIFVRRWIRYRHGLEHKHLLLLLELEALALAILSAPICAPVPLAHALQFPDVQRVRVRKAAQQEVVVCLLCDERADERREARPVKNKNKKRQGDAKHTKPLRNTAPHADEMQKNGGKKRNEGCGMNEEVRKLTSHTRIRHAIFHGPRLIFIRVTGSGPRSVSSFAFFAAAISSSISGSGKAPSDSLPSCCDPELGLWEYKLLALEVESEMEIGGLYRVMRQKRQAGHGSQRREEQPVHLENDWPGFNPNQALYPEGLDLEITRQASTSS
ncbi:hypothetical protein B0H14DRAFT_2581242 [Mycena olivaceomarginata]|nr:hypothetical protein B0H14DRAFT_2581242 [Mycena olivaceomarginata]